MSVESTVAVNRQGECAIVVSAERWFCVCRDGTEHLPLHDSSAAAKHAYAHVQPLPAQVTDLTIYPFTQNSFGRAS